MSDLMRSILALVLCLTLSAGQALAITGDDDFGSTKNPDFVQAAKLFEAGDYAGAIPLLQKSVDANPNNADAHNLLGFSHRKLAACRTEVRENGCGRIARWCRKVGGKLENWRKLLIVKHSERRCAAAERSLRHETSYGIDVAQSIFR